jgi:hypothetical protein
MIHHWAEPLATSGQSRWPSPGRTHWPLTGNAHSNRLRILPVRRSDRRRSIRDPRAPRPSSTRACGWWWPRRCSSRTSGRPAGLAASLDPAEGLQDAQLDDGARVHIVHGDIARGGHVLVNIRTRSGPWASWSGRFHRRARCGGGFERFHCRGRRGGVFRAGSGGFGGRVPAAVRALPPALRGLSLVPPSVGAEPPGRSWFNHRHPLGAQNPWCQHLGSGALACCDPAEPDNADLGAAATLRGSQARGT